MDAGVRPRAWRAALACGVVALAGLIPAGAASAATVNVGPSDPAVDSAPDWSATATRSCGLLCAASGARTTTGGNPGAYLRSSFGQLVSLLADGTVTWRSSTFTWTGASPGSASLSIDRRADVGPLLAINGSLGWTVDLVDTTAGTRSSIIAQTLTTDHPTFETVVKAADASALVNGHVYRIESKTTLNALAAVLGTETLDIDNIKLTALTAPVPSISGTPTATGGRRGVTVAAHVNPNGGTSRAFLEYGPTTAYGSQGPITTVSTDSDLSLSLSGLTPGTTYHARLVVLNADDVRVVGPDMTFTTAALAPPTAGTATAGSLTADGATLTANLNPHGQSTQYRVEYGPTTGYGQQTGWQTLSAGAGATDVSVALSGLNPSQGYHARIVATNDDGTLTGADVSFTTLATPMVGTVPVLGASMTGAVGQNGATLVGTLDDGGLDTDYFVEYGTTAAFGLQTSTQTLAAGSGSTGLSVNVLGLTADTDYYARFVSVNAAGRVVGSTIQFHTDPDPMATQQPVVSGGAAGTIGITDVTVGALIDPNGLSTTVKAQYGLTTAYGQETASTTLSASAGATQVSIPVTGLDPDTTYHVRLVATNADGANVTSDITVHTNAQPSSVVVPVVGSATGAATSDTAATIGATLDDGGAATTYHVAYGTTVAMNQQTADVVLPAGSGATAVSVALSGLNPETTYYAQLVATNSAGTSNGTQVTFTTDPAPVVNQAPTVSGVQTSDLISDGVTVWATVNPRGTQTQYRVNYGPTTGYGSSTSWQTLSAGAGATQISVPVSGLTPSTTYHLQVETTNAGGTTTSSDVVVTTPAAPVSGSQPAVASPTSGTITETGAHVTASIDDGGLATTYYVEYGPTGAYGSQTATRTLNAGSGSTPVDFALTGLTADTQYFARIVATNAQGRVDGTQVTFRTAAVAVTPPSGGGGGGGGGGLPGLGGGGGGGGTGTTGTTGTTPTTGDTTPATTTGGTVTAAGTPGGTTPATIPTTTGTAGTLTLSVKATSRTQTLTLRSTTAMTAATLRMPKSARVSARVPGQKLGTLRAGKSVWRMVATGRTIRLVGAANAPKVTVLRAGGLRVTRLAKGTRSVTVTLNRRSSAAVRRALTRKVQASARQGGQSVRASRR